MPFAPLVSDLGLLYLALAYGADKRLDEAELKAMREQLETWAPGMDPARLDHILNEVMLTYLNGLDDARLDALLARLRAGLDAAARQRVLSDLRTLASADEEVHSEEVAFIRRVETAWMEQGS
jgi:uncharacterized tellurite resistance protein B-like protein